jgi:hypothetical protein
VARKGLERSWEISLQFAISRTMTQFPCHNDYFPSSPPTHGTTLQQAFTSAAAGERKIYFHRIAGYIAEQSRAGECESKADLQTEELMTGHL